MTLKEKIIFGAVVVVVAIIGVLFINKASSPSFGSLGVKLAENYDPYVRYNGGTYTALPIQTTSTLAVGATTTLSANLNVVTSNTATSSIQVGCVQMYATSTATAENLTFVASTTAPTNGSGLIAVVSYGKCPNI